MNWPQLAYQYLIGGTFFVTTLWLCFRSGASDWRVQSDRRAFWLCLVGLVAFLAAHTGWILLAST